MYFLEQEAIHSLSSSVHTSFTLETFTLEESSNPESIKIPAEFETKCHYLMAEVMDEELV